MNQASYTPIDHWEAWANKPQDSEMREPRPTQPEPAFNGWKLVPVKPTHQMETAIGKSRNLSASEIWEDAITAAPPQPPAPREIPTMATDPKNTTTPYTAVRNAWTGKVTYTCNSCHETDFRSEHAARFHVCEPPAQPTPWINLTTAEIGDLLSSTHAENRWTLVERAQAKLQEKNS